MSSRSIAVDSNNHPHFTYGGDHLYYAYYDGSAWHYETVDSSSKVGRYASIALDSSGKVHISYFDETNKDLKYATNASGSWVTTTIYDSKNIYRSVTEEGYIPGDGYTSIAIDASDKVHISYYDFIWDDHGNLIYATNASGSWVTTKVDTGEDEDEDKDTEAGKYNSIAVDSSGNVHISYCFIEYDYSDNPFYASVYADLRYATNASGKWKISTVDGSGSSGWYSSIALDSSGNVHISYCDQLNYVIKYATNVSGNWIITDVYGTAGVPSYTSIALDSYNKVHIGCYSGFYATYVTNASGKWVTEEIEDSLGCEYVSIALDSSNNVHFSYLKSNYAFDYAIKNSDSWIITTFDNGTWVSFCSLAIDSSGNSHISYISYSSSSVTDIMYATNASGEWEISTVDSNGSNPDIALDSSGNVHISYISYALTSSDNLELIRK
ncbi:MAG: hypothetical protein AABY38_08075 [Planctomycetota bacterium]